MHDFTKVIIKDPQVLIIINDMLHRFNRLPYKCKLKMKITRIKYLEKKLI